MATTPTTPQVGSSAQQTLSEWAGPYVTEMLGKTQAVADQPYQVYGGPMTAGASSLQNKVFQGLGNLSFPSNLGQSFASPIGGGNTNNYGGPGGSDVYSPFGGSDIYSPQVMPQQGGFGPGVNNMGSMPSPYNDLPYQGMSKEEFYKLPGNFDYSSMSPEQLRAATIGFPTGAMPPGGDYTKATLPPEGATPGSPEFMSWLQSQEGTGVVQGMPQEQLGRGYAGTGGGMLPFSGGPSDGPYMPRPGQDYGSPQGIAGLQTPQPSMQPSNIAQTYMNPYLQSVLNPQLDELRRQNDITNMNTNAKLTQAGAFGGGRQAIMNAENNRNLMMEQNKTVGQGYANAYDKAMQQFNTEQGQAKTLVDMLAGAGQTQRGIEQEGITADYNEFLAQRDYPQKMLQFQQSMLQGLPISTVSNQAASQSGIGQLSSTIGGLGNILESLKKFNLA